MDISQARILEIGDLNFIKEAFPDRTTLLWTGRRPPAYWIDRWPPRGLSRSEYRNCTPANFVRAMRDAAAGQHDIIVAYLPLYSPWHPRNGVRSLFREPRLPWQALSRVFGVAWLRLMRPPVPLVVVDLNDHFVIRRPSLYLMDKAQVLFKRELPADRWHVLAGSAHPALPTMRIRTSARWQERLSKIRPISLPAPRVDTASLWQGEFPDKTSDIFFSGQIAGSSWVRQNGIAALRSLAERGFKVDIPEQHLRRQDFYRRMSQAWLAWSPAGYGWDTYRTGEAAQCLAVPVVNNPTIERYQPLLHGQHLIQYDVEGDGLQRAVAAALADKPRLRQMALAASDHIQRHHSLTAMAGYIVEAGLALARSRC